ncbi:hypothetical protein [uncultured Methanobrevibacter sp.]|uniref:hypothetical protein n=1 Tax=uncultured Methanobrevibacter sp. TaxID=253161 RepID=UPI0025D73496|nr:hypothetical protein [uncultured Methanobrevibacter sp.]
MRRKKDDKRVLRPGNGNYNKKGHKSSFNRNNSKRSIKSSFMKRNNRQDSRRNNKYNRQKKGGGKTVLVMIIILLAFIIGASAGVFMSFESTNNDTANNTTHIENVTVEMTTNLNKSDGVVFDESDEVDYNENQSAEILGVEDNPYYNNVEHLY